MEHPNDKRKTGKIRQLKAKNQTLNDDKKATQLAVDTLEKQLALEKSYRESQARFETIFYHSKLGNKIIAPDLKILQINEVLQQMLGYTEQEIVGTKIIQYARPDFVHHWRELQENLWTKQIPSFQLETCLVRKDGAILWCQVTSILFQDQEATLGYTILEDISRRKDLELELKKLYDAQETIMHTVAHDLKSPLNNIQSLSGFLKKSWENIASVVPEQEKQSLTFIDLISDTCAKASALIRDLLLIGEFQSEELPFKRTDLTRFIASQLTVLGVEAQKKGVAIRFQHPKKSVQTSINKEKFTRLLENLLSNAVKFTHPGGQVTLSLNHNGQKVLLKVQDTGIGIPAKLQASLFTKFTKAGRQGTQGETTTGLGLYIVKQIVDLHRGKIWLESKEKQGTTFFIELPG